MAEKDIMCDEAENSESSDILFHDEWMIIDDNCSDTEDTNDRNNSGDGMNEGRDNFRSMEVVTAGQNDATENVPAIFIIEKHDEDSDGISVITESEGEPLVANKKLHKIEDCGNHVLGALKVHETPGEKTISQVGTILNVIIACSLAAIIGLGAGRILGMEDKCPVSSAVDFASIQMENDNLINQIKELSEVKDVLDEIKASIPHAKQAHERISQQGSKSDSQHSEQPEKPLRIPDTYTFDSNTKILEQLQTSLNTLCSVIDGMSPENDFIKSDTSRTQSVVADLIEFKKIIHVVVKQFEDSAKPKEMEFLRHAEKRIRNVCESLLSDLSYTVHRMTTKIHHKLNKVRHKLNRKLCLLKNSEPTDRSFFKSLEENNSFLESCDKILNVTMKQNPQSEKNDKQEENDTRIHLKRTIRSKEGSIKQSVSESVGDRYFGDTSSSSSIADGTYDPPNNGFRKKKEFHPPGEKGAKRKSGKVRPNNNSNHSKARSTKSMKSSSGRCFRKLMMDVLVPVQSCPLSKKHWLESKSVHPESQRLGVPISNQKPLYSTVLKSGINIASSARNNFDESPDKQRLLENAQAQITTEAVEQMDQEPDLMVAEEVKKIDLMETKHDVTPAESGINVQTAKGMKKQWNNKFQEPVEKYNRATKIKETLQAEKILINKQEGLQQLESTAEVPSSADFLRPCRRGKRCSPNDSPASARNENNENKYKKSSSEKSIRSEKIRENYKKTSKKGKYDKKNSVPSKFIDTKNVRGSKNHGDKQKTNHRLAGDWQLERSRARKMQRDRDHRSEWFFDRADFRQDARKNMDEKRKMKFQAGRFNRYQPCKLYSNEKCEPIFEEQIPDDEFQDYWHRTKNMNDQKHSNSRAGFTAKKMIKMPHRRDIMQTKGH